MKNIVSVPTCSSSQTLKVRKKSIVNNNGWLKNIKKSVWVIGTGAIFKLNFFKCNCLQLKKMCVPSFKIAFT